MSMYRRPKFLEILLDIRREMAHEADYDVELFAELARTGRKGVNTGSIASKDTGPDTEEEIAERHRLHGRRAKS
jgi:hypothetical protein